MGFYDIYCQRKGFNFEAYFARITDQDVQRVLNKSGLDELDYLTLLSPTASPYLEDMAHKANQQTVQHFGKVISLFTPLYLGDYCVNQCVYCSFNAQSGIARHKLTLEQLEQEAQHIAETGLRHILILTGESRTHTSLTYIKECVGVLSKYFTSIAIEIYPLETEEYQELIEAGVDGLTIYQEVYDEKTYAELHIAGPKTDYRNRLDAPERGCLAGMRTVGVGALLGLSDWRKEAFFSGLHASYLHNTYGSTEISLSLPRIRPHVGGAFSPQSPVNDRDFVQIMVAMRLFLPRVGITISTREKATFRDNILSLGVTKMSAGVSTEVGGHSVKVAGVSQFEISDDRSVKEVRDKLLERNYQPIFKDWQI